MEQTTTLYHGSNVRVEKPEILVMGFYKDFGYGFYCTGFEKQAQKWALTKRGNHVVSTYSFRKDESLKTLSFAEMAEEWLDFVINCRRGIKHDYDIVEGPMADDQIWDYVEDLMEGNITREAFWGPNSSIQRIKSFFAQQKLWRPLLMKGVMSYDECVFS